MREALRGYPSRVSPFHRRRSRFFLGFLRVFWRVGCCCLFGSFFVCVCLLSTMSRSI